MVWRRTAIVPQPLPRSSASSLLTSSPRFSLPLQRLARAFSSAGSGTRLPTTAVERKVRTAWLHLWSAKRPRFLKRYLPLPAHPRPQDFLLALPLRTNPRPGPDVCIYIHHQHLPVERLLAHSRYRPVQESDAASAGRPRGEPLVPLAVIKSGCTWV